MKRRISKYIVYISNDYLRALYDQMGVETQEEMQKIKKSIFEECTNLIKSKENSAIMFDSYIGPKGDSIKSVEIIPLPIAEKPNTLSYLKRLNKKRRKR